MMVTLKMKNIKCIAKEFYSDIEYSKHIWTPAIFQALWWELQILELWKITDFEVLKNKQTNKKQQKPKTHLQQDATCLMDNFP